MTRSISRWALTGLLLAGLFASRNLSSAAEASAADRASAAKSSAESHAASRVVASKTDVSSRKERNPRVLVITSKDSQHCTDEMNRLNQRGGEFAKMRAIGWTIGTAPQNMVQIVDRDEVPDLVEKLDHKEFPTVACIDHGEIVRYFRSGCTTPLDAWTFGFLAKGVDERPAGVVLEAARVESTGSYPLRGNHWSVEGDWNPTREKVVSHLHGPNHEEQLIPAWHIESWSLEELRSLHDDLHEKYDTGTYSSSRSSTGSGSSPATDYLRFKGHS